MERYGCSSGDREGGKAATTVEGWATKEIETLSNRDKWSRTPIGRGGMNDSSTCKGQVKVAMEGLKEQWENWKKHIINEPRIILKDSGAVTCVQFYFLYLQVDIQSPHCTCHSFNMICFSLDPLIAVLFVLSGTCAGLPVGFYLIFGLHTCDKYWICYQITAHNR